MKYNGLSINENAVYSGEEFTIKYDRENLKNSKKVFIHYGTDGWNNVNEIEMLNTPSGFEAKINVPSDISKFNFTFRDENSNWDNNDNNNFEFDVLPSNKDDEVKYFANDFLLKYTNNISFDNKDEENKKEDENITTNSKGLSEEDLEEINFKHTKEELDKTIEAKFAALFGKLENEKNEEYNFQEEDEKEEEYKLVPIKFTSDIPYVSLFKEAKAEAMLSFEETKLNEENEIKPIVYTSDVSLIEVMRMEANRKWVLAQAERNENEEFALVKAFNPVENYDNSFIGIIKQYLTSIVSSFKKLINMVAEDLNPASDSNK